VALKKARIGKRGTAVAFLIQPPLSLA